MAMKFARVFAAMNGTEPALYAVAYNSEPEALRAQARLGGLVLEIDSDDLEAQCRNFEAIFVHVSEEEARAMAEVRALEKLYRL